MVDRIDVVYVENETELPLSIRSNAVCDKNEIGQQRHQTYRSGLR